MSYFALWKEWKFINGSVTFIDEGNTLFILVQVMLKIVTKTMGKLPKTTINTIEQISLSQGFDLSEFAYYL